ncbi:hypothetical protein C0989_004831 [Termitomyces sp. Mn162]|nr:hypothetical protein C0989_004831 [Termitomyces sp. Mn162]
MGGRDARFNTTGSTVEVDGRIKTGEDNTDTGPDVDVELERTALFPISQSSALVEAGKELEIRGTACEAAQGTDVGAAYGMVGEACHKGEGFGIGTGGVDVEIGVDGGTEGPDDGDCAGTKDKPDAFPFVVKADARVITGEDNADLNIELELERPTLRPTSHSPARVEAGNDIGIRDVKGEVNQVAGGVVVGVEASVRGVIGEASHFGIAIGTEGKELSMDECGVLGDEGEGVDVSIRERDGASDKDDGSGSRSSVDAREDDVDIDIDIDRDGLSSEAEVSDGVGSSGSIEPRIMKVDRSLSLTVEADARAVTGEDGADAGIDIERAGLWAISQSIDIDKDGLSVEVGGGVGSSGTIELEARVMNLDNSPLFIVEADARVTTGEDGADA